MNFNPLTIKRFLLASALAFSLPVGLQAQPLPDDDQRIPKGMMMQHDAMMNHQPAPIGFPPRPPSNMMHGPQDLMPVLHHLHLSEDQEDKIFTIHHELEPQFREQMKRLQHARHDLHELALSNQYDEAQAKQLTEVIAQATASLSLLHAHAEQRMLAVLTVEQRAQLAVHLHPQHP